MSQTTWGLLETPERVGRSRPTTIVGFGYKARRGKDTAVKHIIETFGPARDIRRYAFADELKHEVNRAAEDAGGMWQLFSQMWAAGTLPSDVSFDTTPDMSDPLCPLGKQRKLLQWWGSEYRRAQDRNYWVNRLADRIQADQPSYALVSDMRFPNELAWVRSQGGITVRVDRPGFDDLTAGTNPTHQSETALDGYIFDQTVVATNLDDLRFEAEQLFYSLHRASLT